MSFTAGWSVTFGEVATAVRINQLGENDDYLLDAINNRWWEELGRTTLSGSSDTITLSGLASRKYLYISLHAIPTGGTIRSAITFNNDTGTNYSQIISENGAAHEASGSNSSALMTAGASATQEKAILEVTNISTQEKVAILVTGAHAGAAGGANPPGNVREGIIKWANTSNAISRVDFTNSGTGDYASGSELVVLGHD